MSHVLAGMPESSLYLHLLAIGVLALMLALARSAWVVFSQRDGRMARGRRMVRLWVVQGLAVAGLWWGIGYVSGVRERADAHNCRVVSSGHRTADYAAEYCYLRADRILVRLYSGAGDMLLAERTFGHVGAVLLRWDPDALVLDTVPQQRVALPPSWADRVRAVLP